MEIIAGAIVLAAAGVVGWFTSEKEEKAKAEVRRQEGAQLRAMETLMGLHESLKDVLREKNK